MFIGNLFTMLRLDHPRHLRLRTGGQRSSQQSTRSALKSDNVLTRTPSIGDRTLIKMLHQMCSQLDQVVYTIQASSLPPAVLFALTISMGALEVQSTLRCPVPSFGAYFDLIWFDHLKASLDQGPSCLYSPSIRGI